MDKTEEYVGEVHFIISIHASMVPILTIHARDRGDRLMRNPGHQRVVVHMRLFGWGLDSRIRQVLFHTV